MAARPAVVYFHGATIEGYRIIRELRSAGVPRGSPATPARTSRRSPTRATPPPSKPRWRASASTGSAGRARARRCSNEARAVQPWHHGDARRARRSCAANTPCCTARRQSPSPSIASWSRAKATAATSRRSSPSARQGVRRLTGSAWLGAVARRLVALYENDEKLGSARRPRSPPPTSGSALAKAERTLIRAASSTSPTRARRGAGRARLRRRRRRAASGAAPSALSARTATDVRSIDLPDGLSLTFVWTGKPASTAELMAA